jgi:PhnB protein
MTRPLLSATLGVSQEPLVTERPKVAPYLTVSPAAAAIAYYTNVFRATQKALMPAMDGMRIMHCELAINGGAVMLSDAFPEFGQIRAPIPGDPATMSVSLEFATRDEVDETLQRATSLGGKAEAGPMDTFWGTRFAVVRDPFGHRWMLNAPAEAGKKP